MELNAQKREKTGKAVKSLRKEGFIPGVIFGKKLDSLNISVDKNSFIRVFRDAGETTLIDVKIEGNGIEKVLVKDVSYNPITDEIIHIGFYKPNLKEKTGASIPVEVIGEENNTLIKNGDAVILMLLSEIEVEALPTDLPHKFEIDVTNLSEIGTGVTVAELNYDKSKVEIVGLEEDALVLKLNYAQSLETAEEEEISEEEALAKIEATEETAEKEEDEDSKEEGLTE